MYTDFTVLTIEPKIKTKEIIITTNRDIDVNSIESAVIELYERATKSQVLFETVVDDMKIILKLKDWPIPNEEYILSVRGVKNVIGEDLDSNIKKKIVFASNILDTARIDSPSMHEIVKDFIIEMSMKEHLEVGEDPDVDPGFGYNHKGFYIEVATDNAFINTVLKTFTQKNEIKLSVSKKGIQYYARVRIQDGEILEQYGLWSEVTTFIYGEKDESGEMPDVEEPEIPVFPEDDNDEPIVDLDEFEIISQLEQGVTPGDMLMLEFSKALAGIDKSNIIITRKVVR